MEPIGLALTSYSPAFLAGIVVFISALFVFMMTRRADKMGDSDEQE